VVGGPPQRRDRIRDPVSSSGEQCQPPGLA
jgi:hypothetical protein